MIGAVVLAALIPAAGAPAWCDRARERLAGPLDDGNQVDALIETLPGSAVGVKVEARLLLTSEASPGRAIDVIAGAVRDGCAPGREPAAIAAAGTDVAAIIAADPRFGGVRKGDDIIDRVLHKVKLWIASLFESEGMRAYANSARVVYLSVLAVVAVFVAVRIARVLASKKRAVVVERELAAVERRRKRAFASWREDAARALARGDARGALHAGRAALLARIGELDERAVTPARTHREIVARLSPTVAPAVEPALFAFDVLWFGKDAALDDAASFLRDVDAAEARLRPGAFAATTPASATVTS